MTNETIRPDEDENQVELNNGAEETIQTARDAANAAKTPTAQTDPYSDSGIRARLKTGKDYSMDEINAMSDDQYARYTNIAASFNQAKQHSDRLALADELKKKADFVVEHNGDDKDFASETAEAKYASDFLVNHTSAFAKTMDDDTVKFWTDKINTMYDGANQRRGYLEIAKDAFNKGYWSTGNMLYQGGKMLTPRKLDREDWENVEGSLQADSDLTIANQQNIGGVENIHSVGDAIDWLTEIVGENAARMAVVAGATTFGAIAAPWVGMAAGVGAILMGTLGTMALNTGEAVQDQKSEGRNDGDLTKSRGWALVQGIGYSLLDGAFGVNSWGAKLWAGMLRKAGAKELAKSMTKATVIKETEDTAKKATLKGAAKDLLVHGIVGEGFQEAAQSQIVGRGVRWAQTGTPFKENESVGDAFLEAVNEFAGGAAAGLTMGLLPGGFSHIDAKRTVAAYDKIENVLNGDENYRKLDDYSKLLVKRHLVNDSFLETSGLLTEDVAKSLKNMNVEIDKEIARLSNLKGEKNADARLVGQSARAYLDIFKSTYALDEIDQVIVGNDGNGNYTCNDGNTYKSNVDAAAMKANARIYTDENGKMARVYTNPVPGAKVSIMEFLDDEGNPTGVYSFFNDESRKMPLYSYKTKVDKNGKETIEKSDALVCGNVNEALERCVQMDIFNQWREKKMENKINIATTVFNNLFGNRGVDLRFVDRPSKSGVSNATTKGAFDIDKKTGRGYVELSLDKINSLGSLYTTLIHERSHEDIVEFLMKSPKWSKKVGNMTTTDWDQFNADREALFAANVKGAEETSAKYREAGSELKPVKKGSPLKHHNKATNEWGKSAGIAGEEMIAERNSVNALARQLRDADRGIVGGILDKVRNAIGMKMAMDMGVDPRAILPSDVSEEMSKIFEIGYVGEPASEIFGRQIDTERTVDGEVDTAEESIARMGFKPAGPTVNGNEEVNLGEENVAADKEEPKKKSAKMKLNAPLTNGQGASFSPDSVVRRADGREFHKFEKENGSYVWWSKDTNENVDDATATEGGYIVVNGGPVASKATNVKEKAKEDVGTGDDLPPESIEPETEGPLPSTEAPAETPAKQEPKKTEKKAKSEKPAEPTKAETPVAEESPVKVDTKKETISAPAEAKAEEVKSKEENPSQEAPKTPVEASVEKDVKPTEQTEPKAPEAVKEPKSNVADETKEEPVKVDTEKETVTVPQDAQPPVSVDTKKETVSVETKADKPEKSIPANLKKNILKHVGLESNAISPEDEARWVELSALPVGTVVRIKNQKFQKNAPVAGNPDGVWTVADKGKAPTKKSQILLSRIGKFKVVSNAHSAKSQAAGPIVANGGNRIPAEGVKMPEPMKRQPSSPVRANADETISVDVAENVKKTEEALSVAPGFMSEKQKAAVIEIAKTGKEVNDIKSIPHVDSYVTVFLDDGMVFLDADGIRHSAKEVRSLIEKASGKSINEISASEEEGKRFMSVIDSSDVKFVSGREMAERVLDNVGKTNVKYTSISNDRLLAENGIHRNIDALTVLWRRWTSGSESIVQKWFAENGVRKDQMDEALNSLWIEVLSSVKRFNEIESRKAKAARNKRFIDRLVKKSGNISNSSIYMWIVNGGLEYQLASIRSKLRESGKTTSQIETDPRVVSRKEAIDKFAWLTNMLNSPATQYVGSVPDGTVSKPGDYMSIRNAVFDQVALYTGLGEYSPHRDNASKIVLNPPVRMMSPEETAQVNKANLEIVVMSEELRKGGFTEEEIAQDPFIVSRRNAILRMNDSILRFSRNIPSDAKKAVDEWMKKDSSEEVRPLLGSVVKNDEFLYRALYSVLDKYEAERIDEERRKEATKIKEKIEKDRAKEEVEQQSLKAKVQEQIDALVVAYGYSEEEARRIVRKNNSNTISQKYRVMDKGSLYRLCVSNGSRKADNEARRQVLVDIYNMLGRYDRNGEYRFSIIDSMLRDEGVPVEDQADIRDSVINIIENKWNIESDRESVWTNSYSPKQSSEAENDLKKYVMSIVRNVVRTKRDMHIKGHGKISVEASVSNAGLENVSGGGMQSENEASAALSMEKNFGSLYDENDESVGAATGGEIKNASKDVLTMARQFYSAEFDRNGTFKDASEAVSHLLDSGLLSESQEETLVALMNAWSSRVAFAKKEYEEAKNTPRTHGNTLSSLERDLRNAYREPFSDEEVMNIAAADLRIKPLLFKARVGVIVDDMERLFVGEKLASKERSNSKQSGEMLFDENDMMALREYASGKLLKKSRDLFLMSAVKRGIVKKEIAERDPNLAMDACYAFAYPQNDTRFIRTFFSNEMLKKISKRAALSESEIRKYIYSAFLRGIIGVENASNNISSMMYAIHRAFAERNLIETRLNRVEKDILAEYQRGSFSQEDVNDALSGFDALGTADIYAAMEYNGDNLMKLCVDMADSGKSNSEIDATLAALRGDKISNSDGADTASVLLAHAYKNYGWFDRRTNDAKMRTRLVRRIIREMKGDILTIDMTNDERSELKSKTFDYLLAIGVSMNADDFENAFYSAALKERHYEMSPAFSEELTNEAIADYESFSDLIKRCGNDRNAAYDVLTSTNDEVLANKIYTNWQIVSEKNKRAEERAKKAKSQLEDFKSFSAILEKHSGYQKSAREELLEKEGEKRGLEIYEAWRKVKNAKIKEEEKAKSDAAKAEKKQKAKDGNVITYKTEASREDNFAPISTEDRYDLLRYEMSKTGEEYMTDDELVSYGVESLGLSKLQANMIIHQVRPFEAKTVTADELAARADSEEFVKKYGITRRLTESERKKLHEKNAAELKAEEEYAKAHPKRAGKGEMTKKQLANAERFQKYLDEHNVSPAEAVAALAQDFEKKGLSERRAKFNALELLAHWHAKNVKDGTAPKAETSTTGRAHTSGLYADETESNGLKKFYIHVQDDEFHDKQDMKVLARNSREAEEKARQMLIDEGDRDANNYDFTAYEIIDPTESNPEPVEKTVLPELNSNEKVEPTDPEEAALYRKGENADDYLTGTRRYHTSGLASDTENVFGARESQDAHGYVNPDYKARMRKKDEDLVNEANALRSDRAAFEKAVERGYSHDPLTDVEIRAICIEQADRMANDIGGNLTSDEADANQKAITRLAYALVNGLSSIGSALNAAKYGVNLKTRDTAVFIRAQLKAKFEREAKEKYGQEWVENNQKEIEAEVAKYKTEIDRQAEELAAHNKKIAELQAKLAEKERKADDKAADAAAKAIRQQAYNEGVAKGREIEREEDKARRVESAKDLVKLGANAAKAERTVDLMKNLAALSGKTMRHAGNPSVGLTDEMRAQFAGIIDGFDNDEAKAREAIVFELGEDIGRLFDQFTAEMDNRSVSPDGTKEGKRKARAKVIVDYADKADTGSSTGEVDVGDVFDGEEADADKNSIGEETESAGSETEETIKAPSEEKPKDESRKDKRISVKNEGGRKYVKRLENKVLRANHEARIADDEALKLQYIGESARNAFKLLALMRPDKNGRDMIGDLAKFMSTIINGMDFNENDARDALLGRGDFKPISRERAKATLEQMTKAAEFLAKNPTKAAEAAKMAGLEYHSDAEILAELDKHLCRMVDKMLNKYESLVNEPENEELGRKIHEIIVAIHDIRSGKPTGDLLAKYLDLAIGMKDYRRQRSVLDRINSRIEVYQRKLANNDFEPAFKRETPDSQEELREIKHREMDLERLREKYVHQRAAWMLAKKPWLTRTIGVIGEILGELKAIVGSLDLSSVLRQGGQMTWAHPLLALRNLNKTLHILKSDELANEEYDSIFDRPNAKYYALAGIEFTVWGSNSPNAEDLFLLNQYRKVTNMKLIRLGVECSERAFSMYLNLMRADLFDAMVANSPFRSASNMTVEQLKALGNYINVASQRGMIDKQKNLGKALNALNAVFWSPRNIISRFQFVKETVKLALPGAHGYGAADMKMRMMLGKEIARYITGVGFAIAFAKMMADLFRPDDEPPAEIVFDPRSSGFLEVKVGNTHLDFLSGLKQMIVFGSRAFTGKSKNARGQVRDINRPETIFNFMRSKFAPASSVVYDTLISKESYDKQDILWGSPLVSGKDEIGIARYLFGNIVPLTASDVVEQFKENGVGRSLGTFLLTVLGAGSNTYDSQTYKQMKGDFKYFTKLYTEAETPEERERIRALHPVFFDRKGSIDDMIKQTEKAKRDIAKVEKARDELRNPSKETLALYENEIERRREYYERLQKIALNLMVGFKNPMQVD